MTEHKAKRLIDYIVEHGHDREEVTWFGEYILACEHGTQFYSDGRSAPYSRWVTIPGTWSDVRAWLGY